MEIIIGIALIALIIYGIVKLIIFIAPYIAKGFLLILGAGAAVGLLVGTFFGIKNYISSINSNITNKAFKITMMLITFIFILTFFGTIIYLYPAANIFHVNKNIHPPINNIVADPELFVDKIVISDGLNVRAGPSSDYDIKFIVYRDMAVKVSNHNKSGNWVKIKYDDKEGYVNQNFLKEVK